MLPSLFHLPFLQKFLFIHFFQENIPTCLWEEWCKRKMRGQSVLVGKHNMSLHISGLQPKLQPKASNIDKKLLPSVEKFSWSFTSFNYQKNSHLWLGLLQHSSLSFIPASPLSPSWVQPQIQRRSNVEHTDGSPKIDVPDRIDKPADENKHKVALVCFDRYFCMLLDQFCFFFGQMRKEVHVAENKRELGILK